MEKRTQNVYWQAHRGGGIHEAPDNTMAANLYAWGLGGIPEADIRTTKDGVIVCLHDATPVRTTTAQEEIARQPISNFTYKEISQWDAGVKFDPKFAGEIIPSLEAVFANMQGRPERLLYLDLKEVDLEQLGRIIDEYEVNEQVIFAHNVQENCARMKTIAQGVRSMLWIGGKPDQIKNKFEEARASGFNGLDQVQFHLHAKKETDSEPNWMYQLDVEFLKYALTTTDQAGIDLEVLPMSFDEEAIHRLLDIGLRWYATDEPSKFKQSVNSWLALPHNETII